MKLEKAIEQLEFDRAMILFDPTTGEEIMPEILKALNEDNYRTYIADGVAIEALKEVQKYRGIGTVKECREAREKQIPKKPIKDKWKHDCCPSCGWFVSEETGWGDRYNPHCENCGQAIQWDN